MFERYTERARQIVVIGQELARDHRHNVIGVDHLLVACAMEQDGLAGRVLAKLGFDTTRAENLLDVMNSHRVHPEAIEGQIPFSAAAKKALELALREALGLGHNYIGTEHVLLALCDVREDAGKFDAQVTPVTAQLREQGIEKPQVRQLLVDVLNGVKLDDVDVSAPVDEDAGQTQPFSFMPQILEALFQASTAPAATTAPSFRAPSFGLTRPQIQDIGESALYSMDIVGVPPEFVAGYARLADAASHLLNLCVAADEARATA